ncbi:MAG TPA: GYD domain-containing protein [Acidimicrobiales bacterium]|nr:GYD domain-containing protein [Acidimicrobiales bacterium]HLN43151.1 GYD domain-containing protein [Acidimicrobiales bacterium]
MAKYLLHVNYTLQGLKGVAAQGGSAREKAAREAAQSVGGSLDSFYFAFGDTDAVLIGDFPDHVSVAALALAVGSGGGVSVRTTVLVTPKEIDEAAKKQVTYQPPAG